MGPAARYYLLKHNIQIEQIKGSGKDGRIFKHDVLQFVSSGGKPQSKEG